MNDSNNKTGHVTETPDVSYIKNVDVTHEASDVYIGGIAKFVAGLSVLTIAVFLLMWGMFRMFEKRTKEPPRSPMAFTDQERLPPEPRLQGAPGFAEELEKQSKPAKAEPAANHVREPGGPKDPLWEIKVLRQHWNEVLEQGPVDQNGQRYGMPIEKAKEEILKQGLPVRKTVVGGQ
ncbi:MAG TPA: hypothetical protein VEM96_15430 [Pyrinomonadaceae bacterium]|nr:hypothetical protein [Pyrinomonadaceae bacterium]